MTGNAKTTALSRRILELRKARGWSQPELAKKVGTSGPIIGRYERAEITPSVNVARRLAETFGVTLDYLTSDRDMPTGFKDQEMVERWRSLDQLPTEDRDKILYVVDGLIRDARARQAYGA